ncbi:MAG: hypothetical protein KGH84_08500, partial [Paracoccaceae bacterium]|nr:hypothetical protein [Paracoccaceae bacterium]
MGLSKLYFGGTVLASLLLGTTVQAAVTSDQLWTKWQSYASAHGATITAGAKETVGDTTTLKDVTATFASKNSNADVSMKLKIASIDLRDLGDGTVKITATSDANIDESITSAKGETTDISLKVTQDGGSIIASGSADDITYTTAANQVAVALNGLSVKGEDIPVDGSITLSGVNSKQEMKTAADQSVAMTQEGTIDSIALHANGKDTGAKSASFEATGSLAKIAYSGSGTMPVTNATNDFAAMLSAGLTSNVKVTAGASTFSANFTQDDKASSVTSSSDSTDLTVAMDKSHLQYGVDTKGIAVNIKDSKLPFPAIDVKLGESAFNLTMPIAKSDTPQDMALMAKLDGLSVNDEVWAMIDPTKALPRDPATLIVDLSGKGNWLFDVFNVAKMGKPPAKPVDIQSVTLNQLKVAAVGADLSGTG